jgi:hypothetical protein
VATSWIEKRPTAGGKTRYLVKYTLGGRRARKRYAGSFRTKTEAAIRRQWVDGELAARRVPDLTPFEEPVPALTFADAAKRWQASRVDVSENTRLQHRSAVNRANAIVGTRCIDAITAQDVADLIVVSHGKGEARETIRKTVTGSR